MTLLTEPEAATLLRLCERSLRSLRSSGALPYVLLKRRVFYTLADLDTFIEGSRRWDSIKEATPRSGGTASPSMVVGFEAARERLRKASPKASKLPSAPKPNAKSRNPDAGVSTC